MLSDIKPSLRRQMCSVRDGINYDDRARFSKDICCAIISAREYINARAILCYNAVRSEVDLSFLIERALSDSKLLLLPVVVDKSRLGLYIIDDLRDLRTGVYNIPEPDPARCRPADNSLPDIAVVPLLAFSEDLHRLGYGAGYYDRLLPLLRADCHIWGAAYDQQKCGIIPAGIHDVPLERIYTQSRVFIK